MATGTVKWFNGQKGFGFIEPSDGSKDVLKNISIFDAPASVEWPKVRRFSSNGILNKDAGEGGARRICRSS